MLIHLLSMSTLDILINDIILNITNFLNTYDKLMFLSITKNQHMLKDKICYEDKIVIGEILTLWYYDRFTNISIELFNRKLPTLITHLTIGRNFKQDIIDCIPNSVTHLTFGDSFSQTIKDCVKIPKSVTHLTLDEYWKQHGKDFMPDSITHLTIKSIHNINIKNCMSNSITHLAIYGSFNKDIKGCIPNSVTHLTFGDEFDQDIEGCIPESVIELCLPKETYSSVMNIHDNCKIILI